MKNDDVKAALADPNFDQLSKGPGEESLLDVAVERGNYDAIKLLMDDPRTDLESLKNEFDRTVLHQAVLSRGMPSWEIEEIMKHPKIDADILSSVDYEGKTFFHLVAARGRQDRVKSVLEHSKFDPELFSLADKAGRTPLMWAVYRENPKAIKSFMDHPKFDADELSIQDKYGRTAVSYAVKSLYLDELKTIMEHPKFDPEVFSIPNVNGVTPLHSVFRGWNLDLATGKNNKIIELLLDHPKFDPELLTLEDKNGNSLIDLASEDLKLKIKHSLINEKSLTLSNKTLEALWPKKNRKTDLHEGMLPFISYFFKDYTKHFESIFNPFLNTNAFENIDPSEMNKFLDLLEYDVYKKMFVAWFFDHDAEKIVKNVQVYKILVDKFNEFKKEQDVASFIVDKLKDPEKYNFFEITQNKEFLDLNALSKRSNATPEDIIKIFEKQDVTGLKLKAVEAFAGFSHLDDKQLAYLQNLQGHSNKEVASTAKKVFLARPEAQLEFLRTLVLEVVEGNMEQGDKAMKVIAKKWLELEGEEQANFEKLLRSNFIDNEYLAKRLADINAKLNSVQDRRSKSSLIDQKMNLEYLQKMLSDWQPKLVAEVLGVSLNVEDEKLVPVQHKQK